jgi:hypothetical protein
MTNTVLELVSLGSQFFHSLGVYCLEFSSLSLPGRELKSATSGNLCRWGVGGEGGYRVVVPGLCQRGGVDACDGTVNVMFDVAHMPYNMAPAGRKLKFP